MCTVGHVSSGVFIASSKFGPMNIAIVFNKKGGKDSLPRFKLTYSHTYRNIHTERDAAQPSFYRKQVRKLGSTRLEREI